MGYRRCHDVMAATRARSSHGAAVGIPHGWHPVRDADQLRQGYRDAGWQRLFADARRAAGLQAPCPPRLHAVSDLALYPHDPYLERRGYAGLSVSPVSDRALAAYAGKGTGAIMTVTVNGVAVDVSRWPNPETAAARELLRQRAITVGILPPDSEDD